MAELLIRTGVHSTIERQRQKRLVERVLQSGHNNQYTSQITLKKLNGKLRPCLSGSYVATRAKTHSRRAAGSGRHGAVWQRRRRQSRCRDGVVDSRR